MRSEDEKSLDRAVKYALGILSRRQYSQAKMREKLEKRGHSSKIAQGCIERLSQWGYLDDSLFAQDLLKSALRKCPLGKRKAYYDLKKRGFSSSLIQKTVEGVFRDLHEGELAEEAVLRYLNGKDLSSLIEKERVRLYRWLLTRGFQRGTIYPLVFVGQGTME